MSTTIQMVEITNFRNINHLVLNLNDGASIITGRNKLGKSNVLNAINWILTDTLLTDKYGVGENDIDSIVPINHVRGEHTEVAITLSSGAIYSKIYKVSYTTDGSKINGHKTEYKRNGVSVGTQKAFYEELYDAFNFKPAFTSLKINEVRLMTNPLYALLILDAKELRKLLVAMGCTVSNEELYQMGFEYMRPLEMRYGGRWEDVRANAKELLKKAKQDFENHTAQLQLFNGVKEVDHAIYNRLKAERDSLVERRTMLNTSSISDELTELEQQIKEVAFEERQQLAERNNNLDNEIKALNDKLDNIYKIDNEVYENATKGIREQISKVKDEILELNKSYSNIIDEKMKAMSDKTNKNREKAKHDLAIGDLSDRLAHLLNPDNEIECPCCGYKFVNVKGSNETPDVLKQQIEQESNLIDIIDKEITALDNQITSIDARLNENNNSKTLKHKELETLQSQLNNYPRTQTDVQAIKTEINELLSLKVKPLEGSKLAELLVKKDNLTNNARETINAEIEKINTEIKALDENINAEYTKINDYERKQNLLGTIALDQNSINEAEAWLGKVNKFIQTMINLINQRAKEITGFDFVMLEENLTNGNLTEVCYALVDDVPFKDLNTADKFKYGIQFLEVCRRVAANKTGLMNSLPILGDRFESISSVETIKGYTLNQLICTRVNECEEMRVE